MLQLLKFRFENHFATLSENRGGDSSYVGIQSVSDRATDAAAVRKEAAYLVFGHCGRLVRGKRSV